jgi:signal transduction histidine kinase
MISRLEAGYSSENMEVLPVNPILHDVAELYEPVAEDAGLELVVEAEDDISLRINRELVGQTVSNLIDNAIKYSPVAEDGGESRTKITVSMKQAGNQVLISIADQGAGIPEALREQATERFVRLEESRTQPGSGLGLSLAKAVMKLHGGSLMLEDNAPGLRVVLAFPALTETKQ